MLWYLVLAVQSLNPESTRFAPSFCPPLRPLLPCPLTTVPQPHYGCTRVQVFHKAAIDKIFPAIPAGPSKFPDFKNGEEFTPEQRIQMDKHKDAVAHYLVDIGHEDWAMAIPGMSSKKIIELVKTPM